MPGPAAYADAYRTLAIEGTGTAVETRASISTTMETMIIPNCTVPVTGPVSVTSP